MIAPPTSTKPRCRDELPRAYAHAHGAREGGGRRARRFVLAADTVVAAGRRILRKAEDEADGAALACAAVGPAASGVDRRRAWWRRTAGVRAPVVDSVVTFKRLTTAADRRPMSPAANGEGKAGGYAIHGHAAAFVRLLSAATPAWSGCRCSRRRSCCAAWGISCREP